MPTKFPADGNTLIGWLADPDGSAIADIDAPTTTELSSMEDISCDVQSGGLSLGVDTATVDATSICDEFAAQALGRTTVAPTLTGWRYKAPDDTFWALAEKGNRGWLIIRTGAPSDQAIAAADELTLAYVDMSEPAPEFPGGDTLTTFQVSLVLVDGQKFTQKAEVAAAA